MMYSHWYRKRRMVRLLAADHRIFIVAMDHLARLGRKIRMRDPGRILREVSAGGADAVLLRHGLAARHCADIGRMGLILSVEHLLPAHEHGVDVAVQLGADAVKVIAFPDSPTTPLSRPNLAPLAARCEQLGMPLVAEMIPVSFGAAEHHTPERITDAARLGADMGADLLKVQFTGDADSFADLVALAEVPVIILGGGRGDEQVLFTAIRQALDAGAVGAAVGRNVWAHPRPGHMAGALARLIHEDISVAAAVNEVTRTVAGA